MLASLACAVAGRASAGTAQNARMRRFMGFLFASATGYVLL